MAKKYFLNKKLFEHSLHNTRVQIFYYIMCYPWDFKIVVILIQIVKRDLYKCIKMFKQWKKKHVVVFKKNDRWNF